MKQEITDAIQEFLSDLKRHTVEETNEYIHTIEGADNTDCGTLEEDGMIKRIANLDGREPEYFVEMVARKK